MAEKIRGAEIIVQSKIVNGGFNFKVSTVRLSSGIYETMTFVGDNNYHEFHGRRPSDLEVLFRKKFKDPIIIPEPIQDEKLTDAYLSHVKVACILHPEHLIFNIPTRPRFVISCLQSYSDGREFDPRPYLVHSRSYSPPKGEFLKQLEQIRSIDMSH